MNRITNGNPEMIIITWKFTTTCNFKCSYCPPTLHNGKYGFPDYSSVINFLTKISKTNKPIYLDLLGGETTLWPKLIDFLRETKKSSNEIITQITTNGSRTNNWWNNFCNSGTEMNTYLHFTYHPDLINEDLFYKNLEIASKKYFTTCSFMLDSRHIEKTILFFEKVKSNLPVDCVYKVIRKLLGHEIDSSYTKEDLEKINTNDRYFYDRKKYPKESNVIGDLIPTKIFLNGNKKNFGKMIIDKEHNFYNWKCSAGKHRLIIDEEGFVFPCHPLLENKSNCLGNINNNFSFLENYISCPVSYCSCLLDAGIEKFKDNE